MSSIIKLKVEKYVVIGAATGYQVQCGNVLVFNHSTNKDSGGRLKDSGRYDPRTNAQRAVLWLKNNDMVREDAKAEEAQA